MAKTHNLGFPRIGAQRELKRALEGHWKGAIGHPGLEATGADLRRQAWQRQAGLDLVPVGDFSFYDHVLDTSFLLGNVPARAGLGEGDALDAYFRIARGRAAGDLGDGVAAGEMTKWFDTNYHYIVPELTAETTFRLDAARLLAQLAEARQVGIAPKPVLIGPVTYLWLGKVPAHSGGDRLSLLAWLARLLPVYRQLLETLAGAGVEWVQLDEPALVTELDRGWRQAYRTAYDDLAGTGCKLLLTTYFGRLAENLAWAAQLPVDGIHLDAVSAPAEVEALAAALPPGRVLSVGAVSGRNIWKTDLARVLDMLEPLHAQLGDRLWIAPSCSLLHVPVDVAGERALDPELRSWLAFAQQKLEEVQLLGAALNQGRAAVAPALAENARALAGRRGSRRVHDPQVRARVSLSGDQRQRRSPYAQRAAGQAQTLKLPLFPTTTIGSFPQTAEIRRTRHDFRAGKLDEAAYTARMHDEIARAIREQEKLDLDVMVHGEAERNDMVESFAEQLEGFAFSEFGWVQSYGSRCVKPPIIYGDISRPRAMTVEWIRHAQSLTERPVKGMLTGPVTMLNWSFVRDDQPRSVSCYQLALAIREEVLELEGTGVRIIQIDEAALREGLPLRRSEWQQYLTWAVDAFRIAANGVADATQIHTHMCYSEFNDIIEAIAAMDADVITIETSRSNMELLDVFDRFTYPNAIGPGVYDIHSPNVPSERHMIELMKEAAKRIPAARLWVNPDCGLKTRTWDEVLPALRNMVAAARQLRAQFG